jgi:hypothetical protein
MHMQQGMAAGNVRLAQRTRRDMEGAHSALKSLESRPGGMKKRSMKLELPAMVLGRQQGCAG